MELRLDTYEKTHADLVRKEEYVPIRSGMRGVVI